MFTCVVLGGGDHWCGYRGSGGGPAAQVLRHGGRRARGQGQGGRTHCHLQVPSSSTNYYFLVLTNFRDFTAVQRSGAEPEPGHFGRSRSRLEAPAPP